MTVFLKPRSLKPIQTQDEPTQDSLNRLEMKESRFKKYWRPLSAYVYFAIVLFDFVFMPIWHVRNDLNIEQVVELSQTYEKDVQSQILTSLLNDRTAWEPLTLEGGGTFHLAFGALLGASSWTRGREKEERIRQGIVSS